ncbi:MAG: anti-sigma factor family protein [Longimicrobiaceae bacterium]
MSLLTGSRHLGDDDLLRYIDHALDHEGMRLGGVHLRTCAECAARAADLRRSSAQAAEWFSVLDLGAPDPDRRAAAQSAMERARFRRPSGAPMGTPWMKAAAAVVLMVGGGLATEPGRAIIAQGIVRAAGREPGPAARWVLEQLGQRPKLDPAPLTPARTLPPAPAPEPEPGGAVVPPPPAAEAPRAAPRPPRETVKPGMSRTVRFLPAGPDVTLTFASVQSVGIAQVWIREDAQQASVQAVTGFRGEEFVPSRAGLEVRNREGSRADYTIVVPARYRYIRVRVGDAPEVLIHISKSKQEWIWTVNLQTSALQ